MKSQKQIPFQLFFHQVTDPIEQTSASGVIHESETNRGDTVNEKVNPNVKKIAPIQPVVINHVNHLIKKIKTIQEDKRSDVKKDIQWNTHPLPFILTRSDWLKVFDSEKRRFHRQAGYLAEKLGNQLDISCRLRFQKTYVECDMCVLHFRCALQKCTRFYTVSINRNHEDSERYEFKVQFVGTPKHGQLLCIEKK